MRRRAAASDDDEGESEGRKNRGQIQRLPFTLMNRTIEEEIDEDIRHFRASELLELPKKDKHHLFHTVYRVGDLDRTIKFYTEALGLKLLRQRDIPEEKYSNAFLGFRLEETNFVMELTFNYGVIPMILGLGLVTKELGGKITREYVKDWENFWSQTWRKRGRVSKSERGTSTKLPSDK
ncbi:putative lactoylglutathione lyase [Rosa chinensis]|uniref:Putative lactoylglutathione lyase n=1 Tax=Rosa chinensis TaxID=74649 RepID=A0A2P6QW44_ROSCH|nr:lactoylglutathione lyase GLX1 [Rosa chinensis]PRQ38359.1 putative lactoylglutathione lyase [Rosa chinensis]